MKPRRSYLLLSLVLIVFVFCGVSSAFAQSNVSLRFSYYANAGWREAYEQMTKIFEAKNPKIKVLHEPSPWDSYWEKFYAQAAAGTSPDVMLMSGAQFQTAASKNVFLDLGSFFKASKLPFTNYFAEEANSIYKGTRYGVTAMVANIGLGYIKDMFDKAGVAYPNDKWTWSDLLKAAQKLTIDQNGKNATQAGFDAKHIVQWGYYSYNEAQMCYWSFVFQNGGSILSKDLTKCTINEPAAVEAIQFLLDLIYKYHVSPIPGPSVGAVVGSTVNDPFMTGKIAMVNVGNWQMVQYNQDIQSFKWDIASLPGNKKKAVVTWTQAYTISKTSKQAAKAWDLVEFLLGDEASTIAAKEQAWMPSYKPIALSVFAAGPPENMNSFVKELDYAQDFQFNPTWFEYQTALKRSFDLAWEGKESAKAACDKAAKAVNEILQRK